jgi:hypothetical protein
VWQPLRQLKPSPSPRGGQHSGWCGAAQPIPGWIAAARCRVRARVAWPGVVGRTGSGGSTATRSTCGPSCVREPPWSFGMAPRCSTQSPRGAAAQQELAGSEGQWWQSTAPRQDLGGPKDPTRGDMTAAARKQGSPAVRLGWSAPVGKCACVRGITCTCKGVARRSRLWSEFR